MRIKGTVSDYETLIQYFTEVRTHAVGAKYELLELSKTAVDDFTENIEDNRLVMTDFELEKFQKRLDAIKKVSEFVKDMTSFCETEISRFEIEIKKLTNNSNEPIN